MNLTNFQIFMALIKQMNIISAVVAADPIDALTGTI